MNDINLFGTDSSAAGHNILSAISATALDIKEAMAKVAAAKEALDKETEELRRLTEDVMPGLMEEAGQDEVKTADGFKVSVKEIIRAHIKADNQPQAFAWLRSNGHDRLIQRTFTVKFGNNQSDEAESFENLLDRTEGLPEYDDKLAVNAQSLSSFVKKELEEGREVPMGLLGVHRQRVATIK